MAVVQAVSSLLNPAWPGFFIAQECLREALNRPKANAARHACGEPEFHPLAADGMVLGLLVVPGSLSSKGVDVYDCELHMLLAAPPIDGRINDVLLRLRVGHTALASGQLLRKPP